MTHTILTLFFLGEGLYRGRHESPVCCPATWMWLTLTILVQESPLCCTATRVWLTLTILVQCFVFRKSFVAQYVQELNNATVIR